MDGAFRPLRLVDGHLPIEDHGLIGDGRAAALVGRDGSVPWLCAPRFDSPAVFCALLDQRRGGAFRLRPDGLAESRQYYHGDTGVLVTELRTGAGLLRVTDSLTLIEGADLAGPATARGELLRRLEVPHGSVTVQLHVDPRGEVTVRRDRGGWRLHCDRWPDLVLRFAVTRPVDGLRTTFTLSPGEPVYAALSWTGTTLRDGSPDPAHRLRATVAGWQRWAAGIDYHGPRAALVRRSALTLKMLDYTGNGAIVAAATSSLPEAVGGARNWDYRFTWVRDAAFSVYALRRVGLHSEANSFLHWVLEQVEREGEPRILYNVDGRQPPAERVDPELSGYRGSHPVRWGNGAARQTQHDVYGEILDCAHQWVGAGGDITPAVWTWLRRLAGYARARWHRPDHGIWEVRSSGRRFTYSVAMCQVALDRAARLAHRLDLPGDRQGWAAEADKIRRAVLEQAWDDRRGALTEHLIEGGQGPPPGLDAAVLALPLRRVVGSNHPRMRATTAAVAERLAAGGGLLYRYLPDESPDGLAGHEGAFLLCSFWLVDNLAQQGRLDEAGALYESLCGRANPLGLLPEQIDPGSGAFLGNFPQALSHVGVISSGLNLDRLSRSRPPEGSGR
jgi:GH15 family glucan-1,4-alpha-glucosidase